jgi:prepilin peptidase CpaA
MAVDTPALFCYALSACMLWVVITDASRYIISNRVNLLLLGLYVAAVALLPHMPVLSAIAAAGIVLAVGLGMFTLGLMGGGDIKLLVVLSLWTGWSEMTPQFIFLTAIFGGLLVFVVLFARFIAAALWAKEGKPLPRLLTKKQPVPYGIAIAAAFAWLLWTGQIYGLAAA